jgi:hypothetical protein
MSPEDTPSSSNSQDVTTVIAKKARAGRAPRTWLACHSVKSRTMIVSVFRPPGIAVGEAGSIG